MRDDLRERLNVEITRKQFLRYSAGAFLMVFGVDNLISLLTGKNRARPYLPTPASSTRNGFGSRRFGE
jgi:hypothetical protein